MHSPELHGFPSISSRSKTWYSKSILENEKERGVTEVTGDRDVLKSPNE